LRVVTILGARPQFVKAAPVSWAFGRAGIEELIVHTGQHYDSSMSGLFFQQMRIPDPFVNLAIGSGSHGWQTARMLEAVEEVLLRTKPQWTIVYGDTNSTLAGALAAAKLRIPLAHIESGLRSYNREMPEEHNRVLTDHCSDLLLCPTDTAVKNLKSEGITTGVHCVGDTMYDALLHLGQFAAANAAVLRDLNLEPDEYYLATLHRPYNTDRSTVLAGLLDGFAQLGKKVVFPIHPRTRSRIAELLPNRALAPNIVLLDPVGYLEMLTLERNARAIITDSGGVQKEAFFFAVPCVTMRPETEWVETVQSGWNVLVGADSAAMVSAVTRLTRPHDPPPPLFGDGKAAERIAEAILTQRAAFTRVERPTVPNATTGARASCEGQTSRAGHSGAPLNEVSRV